MTPDVRTLVYVNALGGVFMLTALLFYRATQKSYRGLGVWTVGTALVCAGNFIMLARGLYLPLAVDVALTNGLVLLGALVRLDAARLLTETTRLARWVYVLLVAPVGALVYFVVVDDRIAPRVAVVGATAAIITVATAKAFFGRRHLHTPAMMALTVVHLVLAAIVLARSLAWLGLPGREVFDPNPLNVAFYSLFVLLEAGAHVGVLMLNSQRTGDALVTTNAVLESTVAELRRTLSEVKTLSGLLPICAHCKKVRDDNGYWQRVETYVKAHTHAEFSHSICPDCLEIHYPEEPTRREE